MASIKRQADATVARRIAVQIARVHRDARPRQALHVRHWRVVVCLRVVLLLFLENVEDAARRGMARRTGAHGRTPNEDAIAIHVHNPFLARTATFPFANTHCKNLRLSIRVKIYAYGI
jgi:hypothetical protein